MQVAANTQAQLCRASASFSSLSARFARGSNSDLLTYLFINAQEVHVMNLMTRERLGSDGFTVCTFIHECIGSTCYECNAHIYDRG